MPAGPGDAPTSDLDELTWHMLQELKAMRLALAILTDGAIEPEEEVDG